MADVNGKTAEDDWEYEDEDAEDYEWEYETEEEEGGENEGNGGEANDDEDEDDEDDDDEDEIPDPFSTKSATASKDVASPTNGHSEANGADENGKKKHKKHKKSNRHLERIEGIMKDKEKGGISADKSKKIHVRSKDPLRIARQFEKAEKKSTSISSSSKHHKKYEASNGKKGPAPPPQKINTICKICGKEPYQVERIIAEKSWWHKNCFRCSQCNKILNLDTYMSHEGILYCKPHHKELFLPKAAKNDTFDPNMSKTQELIMKRQEQQRKMETIICENTPEVLEGVVKSSTNDKYSGLENLDVGSKFAMFEKTEDEERGPASDRYGIMEKLKRMQEGADIDELLAELDEELPSDECEEDEEDEDDYGLTEVQKKTKNASKLFSEDVKKHKKDEATRKELQALRQKLNCGGTSSAIDAFDDLLNASSNKVTKTRIDVKSENAKRFRDMFDKGEVPEKEPEKQELSEKDAELAQMRKNKREQREYFKKMEEGKLDEPKGLFKEPKLHVGKIKNKLKETPEDGEEIKEEENLEDLQELASLSTRFNYFENFESKEEDTRKKSKDHEHEAEQARRECKAKSVLNKWAELENKAMNGEDDAEERRRPLKKFTPPRKLGASESESGSESDYSDSEYSDSSYTSSYSSSTESDEEDETLKAIRNAQRAKELRAKFEEWENSQDAKDQAAQMAAFDENGEPLETASILRRKFEALRMHEEKAKATPPPMKAQFRPKRFK